MSTAPLSIQKSPELIVQQTCRLYLQSSIFGNTTLIWPWEKSGISSILWGPFCVLRCLKCSTSVKHRDKNCLRNPKCTGDYWKLPSIPTWLISHSVTLIYCSTSKLCFLCEVKKVLYICRLQRFQWILVFDSEDWICTLGREVQRKTQQ